MTDRTEVGKVAHLAVFPFKGMQGIVMDEVMLKSVSVVGDRRFAFSIRDSIEVPTFLDTIKYPGLLTYQPRFVNSKEPKTSEVLIKTSEGVELSADSQDLLDDISRKSGRALALVKMGRGAYHSMPVSLLSMGSVRAVGGVLAEEVDIRRFRENIVIETIKGEAFEEDGWIGEELIFGDREDSARIVVLKPDDRCATINLDPETGEHRAEFLKSVVSLHNKNLGVYCTIVKEGKIHQNDPVYLTRIGR